MRPINAMAAPATKTGASKFGMYDDLEGLEVEVVASDVRPRPEPLLATALEDSCSSALGQSRQRRRRPQRRPGLRSTTENGSALGPLRSYEFWARHSACGR